VSCTPVYPERYVPRTYQQWQEQLAERLADHIEKRGLTTTDICQRWPSCRAHHLKALRDPEMAPLGLKMLLQLAEATGLRVDLRIAA